MLGFFKQGIAFTAIRGIGIARNLRTNINEATQNAFLADNLRVGLDIGGAGRCINQFGDVGAAVHQVDLAVRFEPLCQRDRIAGPPVVVQGTDGLKDGAVIFAVEILFGDDICDLVPGTAGQQQPPQHGLLGIDRVRRNANLLDSGQLRFRHLFQSPVSGKKNAGRS